jgi:hypothetical protein
VQSLSGVKRQMLPVPVRGLRSGLMFAGRVRELRSRSLMLGWPEHPLARLLICLFPGMSPGSRSLRLGWQGCPLARILTLNPVMWNLPERRPEAGPLSAGRVPWP